MDDVLEELPEDGHQLVVARVASLKLPVGHLNAYFLAGDLHSCLVDEVEQVHKIILSAVSQVVGVDT